MNYMRGASLEDWIDANKLRQLEDQWKAHLENYDIVGDDAESVIRLMFISLREDQGLKR